MSIENAQEKTLTQIAREVVERVPAVRLCLWPAGFAKRPQDYAGGKINI